MDEDPIVTAAWSRVLEHWDHKPSHDRFVSVCHERGMLGHAASKYKAVAEGLVVPEGDASLQDDRRDQAHKRLGTVALLAVQSLEASREPPRSSTPRWLRIAVGVFTAVAFAWFAWALSR